MPRKLMLAIAGAALIPTAAIAAAEPAVVTLQPVQDAAAPATQAAPAAVTTPIPAPARPVVRRRSNFFGPALGLLALAGAGGAAAATGTGGNNTAQNASAQ